MARWRDWCKLQWGQAAELSYHLLSARDLGLLKAEDYGDLSTALDRIMKMLSALSGKNSNIAAA
jgi:four helix bundle protein